MAEAVSPITRQVNSEHRAIRSPSVDFRLEDVEDCLIYDRHGVSDPFKKLYQDRKSVIIFVRNFLCYSCKEYVEDLSKIPKEALEDADIRLVVIGQSAHHHIEPFCSLTGYPHEIYVDPERCIYQKLGMKREEKFTDSASCAPKQGGAIIAGPGSHVHFSHFDMNRLDHMPINWLLQLAGVQQTLDFSDKPKIVHV
ncbi:hypothetical protein PFLUV_G00072030 [Perca fluviatilis]|uniref:Thioredoxin domain-containing protein n=2 Tax=Perca fluviatilis TaxID=8168 RepID=A0A6A5FKC5_PERFL|nr:hypothetical protein PFLUV_G00072030 [Perca fluviatilis]